MPYASPVTGCFLGLMLLSAYSVFSEISTDLHLKNQTHVGLIDLIGEIADEGPVNADDFTKSLDTAYKSKHLKALILRINSPGGSPVQADYMYHQLRIHKQQYPHIPVYAVCMDMCASAAYYAAAGATYIYANPSSLVGSIGVLYDGFGFVDTLKKIGVDRRLYTSGSYKGFLDPFSPTTPQQVQLLQTMLQDIHQTFIARVKEGRGKRLHDSPDLFSGLFWTGIQAKKLGLIDDFGSAGDIIHTKLHAKHVVDYTIKKSILDRFAKNINSSMRDPQSYLKSLMNVTSYKTF